jgi:flagellar hook-associated protein 3 FlgL
MRVTGKMLRDKVLYNIQSSLERMQFAQTQVATGKRILKPSDDAVAVSKTLKVRNLLADNEQYQRNMDDGVGWVDSTEPALDAASGLLAELKEIALSGASDTNGADERRALAEQVEGLLEEMVQLANTQYDQRYVFAGTYTLTRPYSATRSISDEPVTLPDSGWTDLTNGKLEMGSVTVRGSSSQVYVEGTDYEIDYTAGRIRRLTTGEIPAGDACQISYGTQGVCRVDLNAPGTDGALRREVAPGVWEQVNIGGEEFLNSGVNAFDLMVRVKNALYKNDGAAVNQTLNDVDTAFDQVSAALGEVGHVRKSFDLAGARLDTQNVNLKAMMSGLEDADLAEVMVRFQAERAAYESALSAAGNIMNTSLINFLQ